MGPRHLFFSAITGSNLFDLARNKFPESEDQALQKSLEDALKALTSYGVKYRDERLDNFLWADGERVMVIDLSRSNLVPRKCGREATIMPPPILSCANSGELAIRTTHHCMTSIPGVTCHSDGIIVSGCTECTTFVRSDVEGSAARCRPDLSPASFHPHNSHHTIQTCPSKDRIASGLKVSPSFIGRHEEHVDWDNLGAATRAWRLFVRERWVGGDTADQQKRDLIEE